MIGPHCEVELPHNPLCLASLHLQGEVTDCVLCKDDHFLDEDLKRSLSKALFSLIRPILMAFDLKRDISLVKYNLISSEEVMTCDRNSLLTLPFSSRLVTMTIELTFCSQIILQKSVTDAGVGPE